MNVDVFGNDIFDTSDDGIEADNGRANVRMWRNRIHNAVHNGRRLQPGWSIPVFERGLRHPIVWPHAVRVANAGTGARFRVSIDDVDRTGPVSVPNTGGWQMWQPLTKTGLSLTAGSHVMTLVFDTGTAENGGVRNYNWVRFVAN